jgi:ATP-dependent DNA ligase
LVAAEAMTREEIEQKMEELARKYIETHDPEIREEIYRLGRELEKMERWALTKEDMKNCVWLKPELVGQIEFTEWIPDGPLGHSKFVGLTATF